MKTKKSKQANLEKKRGLFFQIALILVLIILILAFERGTRDGSAKDLGQVVGVDMDVEMVEIARIKKPKPKKEKQKKQEFEIVENDVEIDKNDEFELHIFEEIPDDWLEIPEIEEIKEEEYTCTDVFYAEQMPRFPGGEEALKQYIINNIEYPIIAQENDIQGKVYVKFLVTRKGEVQKAQIVRSIDPLLDEEAIRIVNSMPKWTAGKQSGRKVSVWLTIPIVFKLL